ncbi:MAG TPA: FemAB family XrtA/PEP-CTERM system-associated protein [Terriglobales bacterium]|nr:FemAB family XrtA/PEP-CTERM system-associated protein [Terriglobales bacterium]
MAETTASAATRIATYSDSLRSSWDAYAHRHPDSTIFHTIAWKRSVEREFGFQSHYLYAERNDQICGILPLFLLSNLVMGKVLISTPFAVYGGPCADDDPATLALVDAARKLAQELRVQHLELRNRHQISLGPEFHEKDLYVSFDRDLPKTEDELMKSLPRDTRYMIRKGLKAGLTSVIDNSQVATLHHIYAQSVHNLGTPVFSQRWFEILREEFGDALQILIVNSPEGPIAAVQSFKFREWIIPFYGGAPLEARKYAANNVMYWEVMRRAQAEGLTKFDFGRSKRETGAFFFKTQWTMTQHQLPYKYFLVRRKEMPNFSPNNKKFQLAIECWKKLPLPITKWIGPPLVKLFP